jgi:hypothetical protein
MFTNKIAGASVAYAIGLASAEFAKSLTLKAVIPSKSSRIFRLTCVCAASKYDFEDISTMALYWTYV